ncbi:hypothetical protein BN863_17490 [Formosa agariphila KMM 3901]|uniref:Uncharacterized protein n=1 Tax=Formosa agariphila (strain DSM 15362 / KCTC 12365 / LMG 23005 / KMM 3901 / M-2Alg 35-1) TaxID=1347342 RepID=T2KM03_FORAG|nr:hypothetical protein [Formosa agariphila]CDF79461.1 hypothetical protein BN863_17490 [Formosa agariphila KMM 3901]
MSILSSLFGINTATDDAITVLNANQFRTAVQHKNVQLVDVRTARE